MGKINNCINMCGKYGVYVDTASDISLKDIRVKVDEKFPDIQFGGVQKLVNIK